MSEKRLVKDYKGDLIPKINARKIAGKYYQEGTSCFQMEDGQWYRIDSPKVAFDHFTKKYVLLANTALVEGYINERGDRGYFSNQAYYITLSEKRGTMSAYALNEDIAVAMNYEECISDGIFYKKEIITDADRKGWFGKKDIPKSERSADYNLEQDQEKKKRTIEMYERSVFPISLTARKLAKYVPFTIGMEVEVINGFLPSRIRHKYGLKALKDGSLRHEGGEGIEYVSMPMSGPKAIQTILDSMREFSKRCVINNYCSLHFHFGNVRKDKLYILSLFKLIYSLQAELIRYFPFSRFNSIKADGKVYCKPLENHGINYKKITSSKNEEEFHKNVVEEFNKIYTWLNNGKPLAEEYAPPTVVRQIKEVDGKKMFCDTWMKNIYSTKTIHHAITSANKWDKPTRYYIVNFLNLFFSKIGTVEFRCHESTTNANKALIWLLTCSSILKYAENINKVFSKSSISLKDVLMEELPEGMAEYISEYFVYRNRIFFSDSSYRQKWQNVEANWFHGDPEFKFTSSKNYKFL